GDNVASNFLVPNGTTPPEECLDGNCTVTPIGRVLAAKSSDPESGSAVVADQIVTYTLSFENDGHAAADVHYVDDLAGVLDD
ncbi:hypothetical protein, partial [Leifsonia sp. SIMBA_070]|uniref:DUF7927 domain-containing protein n=1 Tax=Leifsonia sp. SIMBA_070 TaxID=3085810 RepID=UPI00397DE9C9